MYNTTLEMSHLKVKVTLAFRNGSSPEPRPRGYKTFFVLNSVEHEILNAHKYKNIKTLSILQAQISLECYFSR